VTVQLRVRRDAPDPNAVPRHRLDWDTDPELGRFAGLTEDEKMRVIIRVLCGLVALEESPAPFPSLVAPPPAEPAPKRRRLLPFLGYENPPAGPGAPVVDLDAPLPPSEFWTRVGA
jgi:hypothetical protein